jgi:hypothetical protein
VSFAAITLCVASQRVFIVVSPETFGYTLVLLLKSDKSKRLRCSELVARMGNE